MDRAGHAGLPPLDMGPESRAATVRRWLDAMGVETLLLEPGSSWENGWVESCSGAYFSIASDSSGPGREAAWRRSTPCRCTSTFSGRSRLAHVSAEISGDPQCAPMRVISPS